MFRVYLGLGSNLGDRLEYLSRAVQEIGSIVSANSISSVYETEPVGMESDTPFYNMALGVDTPFYPPELLLHLKKIERKLGRKRGSHMQPREIDIDILLYRGYMYEDPMVQVPHPFLEHRRFALEPLNEIAPTAIHPQLNKTIASLLRECRDRAMVSRTVHLLTTEFTY